MVGSESVTTRLGCDGRVTSWPDASVTVRVADVSDVADASGDEAGAGWLDEHAPRARAVRATPTMARIRVDRCTGVSIQSILLGA